MSEKPTDKGPPVDVPPEFARLRTALHDATEELNQLFHAEEAFYAEVALGVSARVPLFSYPDADFGLVKLGYDKLDTEWGLYVSWGRDREHKHARLAHAKREWRLAAVRALPDLRKAVYQAALDLRERLETRLKEGGE